MSKQLKDKTFILKLMSDVISRGYGLKKIIFSYNSPKMTHTFPWVRIMIPLEGQLDSEISQDYTIVNIQLNPGDILFCLTNGAFWSYPKDRRMLTIIYWNELIRFLYEEGEDSYYYHTSKAINSVGTAVLNAIILSANKERLQIKTSLLLNALLHITYEELDEDIPTNSSKAYNTFQHILNYISYNFHKPINRQTTAKAVRITPQHLSRLFKMYSENSFNMTIKKMRLNYALELLKSGQYSVNEAAEHSGFMNVGYFITEFKKMFNSTPGKFQ
jgi:AraC-like DNA-binding protein